jgi:protocatechuate 3,4-dioxygenase beta subunit
MRHVSITKLATCFVLAVQAYAQTFTGSISGRVIDQQGAAVSNATVTASEPSKNIEETAKSGDQGEFSFSSLQPGNY